MKKTLLFLFLGLSFHVFAQKVPNKEPKKRGKGYSATGEGFAPVEIVKAELKAKSEAEDEKIGPYEENADTVAIVNNEINNCLKDYELDSQIALAELKKIALKYPNYIDIQEEIAFWYLNNGMLNEAINYFDKLIFLEKSYARNYSNRAGINRRLKNYEKSLEDHNSAVKLAYSDHDRAFFLVNRGYLKLEMKDTIGASKDFDVAAKISFKQLQRKASFKLLIKDYKGALADYDYALKMAPRRSDSVRVSCNRTQVYELTRDYKSAISVYESVLKDDPDQDPILYLLGEDKNKVEDFEGAKIIFDRILAKVKTNVIELYKVYCQRGIAKENLNDFDGAMEDYNKGVQLFGKRSNYPLVYFLRGKLKFKKKQYKEALEDYDLVIKKLPFDPFFLSSVDDPFLKDQLFTLSKNTYLARAELKEKLADYQGAIEDCEKAIFLDSKFAKAYYVMGSIKLKNKQGDSANLHLEKAKSLGYINE
ncbi:MAG: tetratricopeptide repeat protein [Sphingobacteriaceae bacterium]|nr:tetratricopeptide repeat protein [Sphingobacteriaceae bacterium]